MSLLSFFFCFSFETQLSSSQHTYRGPHLVDDLPDDAEDRLHLDQERLSETEALDPDLDHQLGH